MVELAQEIVEERDDAAVDEELAGETNHVKKGGSTRRGRHGCSCRRYR